MLHFPPQTTLADVRCRQLVLFGDLSTASNATEVVFYLLKWVRIVRLQPGYFRQLSSLLLLQTGEVKKKKTEVGIFKSWGVSHNWVWPYHTGLLIKDIISQQYQPRSQDDWECLINTKEKQRSYFNSGLHRCVWGDPEGCFSTARWKYFAWNSQSKPVLLWHTINRWAHLSTGKGQIRGCTSHTSSPVWLAAADRIGPLGLRLYC